MTNSFEDNFKNHAPTLPTTLPPSPLTPVIPLTPSPLWGWRVKTQNSLLILKRLTFIRGREVEGSVRGERRVERGSRERGAGEEGEGWGYCKSFKSYYTWRRTDCAF